MNDTARSHAAAQTFNLSNCTLVPIDTIDKAEEESMRMRHAMHYMWTKKMFKEGDTLWSLRDANGVRVLSMLANADKVCRYVVGKDNRKPTPEELQLLEPLLVEHGMTLNYVGAYVG